GSEMRTVLPFDDSSPRELPHPPVRTPAANCRLLVAAEGTAKFACRGSERRGYGAELSLMREKSYSSLMVSATLITLRTVGFSIWKSANVNAVAALPLTWPSVYSAVTCQVVGRVTPRTVRSPIISKVCEPERATDSERVGRPRSSVGTNSTDGKVSVTSSLRRT